MINYTITPEHAKQILETGRLAAIRDRRNDIELSKAHIPYRKSSNKESLWVNGYLMEVIRYVT